MTIKVTANQWYWTYEYPDQGITFDSYMVPEKEIDPKTQTYLLSVDNPLVVPVGKSAGACNQQRRDAFWCLRPWSKYMV